MMKAWQPYVSMDVVGEERPRWRTIPDAAMRAGTIRWLSVHMMCLSRGWKAEDMKTRRLDHDITVDEDVPDGQSASEKNEWIRTILNPPHGFDHKEHHLTDVWPWRSKREQKNEGRDKWNWRERWNCESLWFSVSIELKHGTKGSLLGWCLVHQFVNQDDISGVKIMTRHRIWHASPDMTVTWESSAKGDNGLLMPPKTMWRDSRVMKHCESELTKMCSFLPNVKNVMLVFCE